MKRKMIDSPVENPPPAPKAGDFLQVFTGSIFLVTDVKETTRKYLSKFLYTDSGGTHHTVSIVSLSDVPSGPSHSFIWEDAWVVNQDRILVNSLLSSKELLQKYPDLRQDVKYEKWDRFMFFGKTNVAKISAFLKSSRHYGLVQQKQPRLIMRKQK